MNYTRRPWHVAGSSMLMLLSSSLSGWASDHQEAPTATAQLAADIGDYYAWHDENTLNLILTFGTFNAPGMPAIYSADTLYGFHFDTSVPSDGIAESNLYARFAQDPSGNWGVQVFDESGVLFESATQTVTENEQGKVWAGLSDDPFFFDLTGFNNTVSTGQLSFDPTRDDVAGLNITSIAIQVPLDSILNTGSQLSTWATTGTL